MAPILIHLKLQNLLECPCTSRKAHERLVVFKNYLSTYRLVKCDFDQSRNAVYFIFNCGIVSWFYFENYRIKRIYHDHYLVGKLVTDHIVDFELRRQFAFISYNQAKLTFIKFADIKSSQFSSENQSHHAHNHEWCHRKFKNLNLEISHISTNSCISRRFERFLLLNDAVDTLIVWWNASANSSQPAPWSPIRNQQDLSNILIYAFDRKVFEIIACGFISDHIYEVSINLARGLIYFWEKEE